ncbi:MAG: acyltransferase [Rickettsiales bacterium]|nr:acyltransferase [Rickettsiales bacterium]
MAIRDAFRLRSTDIPALYGLRGAAALWVMAFHAWSLSGYPNVTLMGVPLNVMLSSGRLGVDGFFVLSAFLLTGLLLKQPDLSWRNYVERRALRILPAYYIHLALLVMLALGGVYGHLPRWPDALAHILMLHNLRDDWIFSFNNISLWSLPVEFSFYLMLPLLFMIAKRHWGVFLLAAFLLTLLYRWIAFGYVEHSELRTTKFWLLEQLPGRLDQFACGMLAAFVHQRLTPYYVSQKQQGQIMIETLLISLGVLGIALLGAYWHSLRSWQDTSPYWNGDSSLFWLHGAVGACYALLILGLACDGRVGRRLLGNRLLLLVGLVSYGLYLWHEPFLSMIQHVTPSFEMLLMATLPVALVAGTASFILIERPCEHWARQRHRLYR